MTWRNYFGTVGSTVQDIVAPVVLENASGHNVIDINDTADYTARTVTISTLSTSFGEVNGLAPVTIDYTIPKPPA